MTVIIGFNLSDRILIAADTRVSNRVNGVLTTKHDNMLKIENIDGILIACAGDAGLAGHIIRKLRSELFVRRGIDTIKEHIESWIVPVCDEYWHRVKDSTHVTFIFGGRSTQRRKRISRSKFETMMKEYSLDPDLKGQFGKIKKDLFECVQRSNSDQIKTTYSDTVLFSLSVSFEGIYLKTTEWGECLIYGPKGIKTSDIIPSQIARLEFGEGDRLHDHGVNRMMVTAYIYDLVQKKSISGVGPTIVTTCVGMDGLVRLSTGGVYIIEEFGEGVPKAKSISEIKVIDNKIYRTENGITSQLIPVSNHNREESLGLIL